MCVCVCVVFAVTVFPSKCEEIRDGLTYPTSYRPQCTADGEFAPVQCHREYGECWCVDRDGIETAVERTRYPVRPDCGTGTVPVRGMLAPVTPYYH